MQLTVELNDSQIAAIAEQVAERLRDAKPPKRPLTVKQFADAVGLGQATVYRQIEAGEISRVKGLAKILIPASELERFL